MHQTFVHQADFSAVTSASQFKELTLPQSEKPGDSVRAVARALDILLAFTTSDDALTASDLLKRVDLSRPTLYRLLHTLEEKGFIKSSGDPQRFKLGSAVGHLSHVWTASLDVATVAQPMMQELWNATKETVALFLHRGNIRACIAELPSPQPLSFKRGVGYTESIFKGASGRAILAFMDDTYGYVNEHTASGEIPNPGKFLKELERIKHVGHAISKDELITGAVAIAAPFFGSDKKVMGSLAVFGPSARLDEKQISLISVILQTQAKKLSEAFRGL